MTRMSLLRGVALTGRLVGGSCWAGVIAVPGLLLIARDGVSLGSPSDWFGLSCLAIGQFVFMFAVADRVFPGAHKPSRLSAQVMALAIGFAALLVAMMLHSERYQ